MLKKFKHPSKLGPTGVAYLVRQETAKNPRTILFFENATKSKNIKKCYQYLQIGFERSVPKRGGPGGQLSK